MPDLNVTLIQTEEEYRRSFPALKDGDPFELQ